MVRKNHPTSRKENPLQHHGLQWRGEIGELDPKEGGAGEVSVLRRWAPEPRRPAALVAVDTGTRVVTGGGGGRAHPFRSLKF